MGSLAATRSRSSLPIVFSTAEFTPNSGIVVARSAFLRLRRSVVASSSGEADPPLRKVEPSPRRLLSALANNGPKAFGPNLILQLAADSRGNGAETRNELGE